MSSKEQLVGRWKLVSLKRHGKIHPAKCAMEAIIRLDETYDLVIHTAERELRISGTYKICGNKIKRFFEEELELDTCTFHVCDGQMTLYFSENETFTFQKLGRPSSGNTRSVASEGHVSNAFNCAVV